MQENIYCVSLLILKLSAVALEVLSIRESRIAGTLLSGDIQETGCVLGEYSNCKLSN